MTLWEATPLPRGRHGLPRENVTSAQRSRIFDALTHAVSERGYGATPVAEILRRAGVSRETFYQQFSSKDECLLAYLDEASATFESVLTADRPGEAVPPAERLCRLLDTWLSTVADDPERARVLLVETYGAGPDAILARMAVLDLLVEEILAELDSTDRFAAESLVSAIVGRVTMLLASDDPEGISELGQSYAELAGRLALY